MVIRAALLQIKAAERKICAANRQTGFVKRNNLKKTAGWDHGSVSCNQIRFSIETEGNAGKLAVHADAKEFILFQHLAQTYFDFLTVII